ncbi:MAG: hypothetical protein Q8R96_17765 [Bacteroidota bacterium]|nr:hypothetical protein [Bacteroidota bacterium]
MLKKWFFKALLFIICISPALLVRAQDADKQAKVQFFTGAATVTTKGLSTFPNLSLGKPAAILDLSMGGKKFRFEPIFRFALEGKPWSFILWCRYELLNNEKFQFKIGAHPAYSFKMITVTQNGTAKEILRAQQFFAGELAPVFKVGKNFSLGPYYIYARGLEKDIVRNSNFISFRANFSNIGVTDKYFMRLMTQAYYLKMDTSDGFYVNSTLSLNRRNSPFSVSSTMNKTIQSDIPGDDFLWNINLTYSFRGI